MKRQAALFILAAGLAAAGSATAQATVGQAAPAFSVVDTAGKAVSLADYKGKYVVLEWVNPSCPFVKKHYNSGNMQKTQKYAAGKNVVWLSVNTSEEGAAGKPMAELATWIKDQKASPNAMLVDDGKVGRAYGARTTPHMYLIDPAGKLVYAGAIDSKASASAADIAGATNYVVQAIDEASAGKPISRSVTQPYGCAVKYG